MTKGENIVEKGEIARSEQFLLLSLCFQKAVFDDRPPIIGKYMYRQTVNAQIAD